MQSVSSWRRRWMASLAAVAFCGGPGMAAVAIEPPENLFRDRVAPLLAAKCGACHGPDGAESGFRIDDREKAAAGGDSGSVGIVPGKPDESELFVRVSTSDKESRMPAEGDPLTADEQALIKDWIAAGAVWPDAMQSLADLLPEGEAKPAKGQNHWAFQPLMRPPVPHAPHGAAPIDAFLTEKLAATGLAMNPEADPRTLIRRVSFDLTGLPPSPEEIAVFEDACRAAGAEGPYRELVDRLLASPHYGERWARHWLDVARFAESDGFETNKTRSNAWPYRDWVIESFNADKPYDQFVKEQLYGDQIGADAATGFIVGGPKDRVGSPDPVLTANQRADELHDMVGTTGSAFLGLTIGCARCHDHKFDPIPQTDYYAVKAVFEGVQHGDREILPPGNDERLKKLAAVEAQLTPMQRRSAELQPAARLRRTIVIDDLTTDTTAKLIEPKGVADHAGGTDRGHAAEPGTIRALPNLGKQYQWWAAQPGEAVFAYAPKAAGVFRIWISWGAGWSSHTRDARYVLDADGDPGTKTDQQEIAVVDQRLFADGSGDPPPNESLWSGFRDAGIHHLTESTRLLVVGGAEPASVTADVVIFEEAELASDSGGLVAHLRGPVTAGATVDAFPPVPAKFVRFTVLATNSAEPCIDELEVLTPSGRNLARRAKPSSSGDYANNTFHKLAHINDGLYGNKNSWISNQIGGGWVQLELPEAEEVSRVVWSRDRSPKPEYSDRLATQYEIAVSLDGQTWMTVATHADRLPPDYVHAAAIGPITTAAGLSPNELAELESLEENIAGLEKQRATLTTLPKAYAGQFVKPPKTYRFFRGDPVQPREEIVPGSLSNFGSPWQLPADAPEPDRRRALADWIVDASNPLAARVIVNRLWHYHFGTGIVDTPSDFGVNGGAPTHPELLDWLASELVDPANTADCWRLKRIHRLIVTSRAYRQSSIARPEGLAADSNSRLLWRYPPRRLEAEPLRDAILAVSGSLNPKMGGPGFDLFEPNTNYVKVYNTKTTFTDDDLRRMVYQSKPRAELDSFFGAFDCPDAGQVQPARTVSTTPLQALNMLNGEFLLDQAARFAMRVEREAGSDPGRQVARAFELAFGRAATDREVTAGRELVAAHGLPILCRSLYNASEFITVY